jgi:methionyl-tRNA formyltransferase
VLPSFWMLANGESHAGVSVHFVDERIDGGELCGQTIFEVRPDETLDDFLKQSKRIGAELLADVLERLENGTLEPSPLNLSHGSYCSWPDRAAVRRFAAAGRRLW